MRPPSPFQDSPSVGHEADWLEDRDRAVLWKPFTQMQPYQQERPLVLVEGRGSWLRDARGKEYLDANASLWVNVHGHGVPQIVEAIQRQAQTLDHASLLGPSNDQAICFAHELLQRAPPGLSRVFYSDSGSTAVEVALKMALQYHQQAGAPGGEKRVRYLSFRGAYHGDTVGAVSVGGIDTFHQRYGPLLFDGLKLPQPHRLRWEGRPDEGRFVSQYLSSVDRVLEQQGDSLAAVILEPLVQGAAGMITYPEQLLRGVVQRCREAGALIIVDEVATGFGRTGSLFASERAEIRPDLMALAKGISGGVLPLAATLTTEAVYQAFLGAPSRTFFHGHSYTGNPMACAAARASLSLFEQSPVLEHVAELGRVMAGGLEPLAQHPHVLEIRQIGVMVAVELVQEKESMTPYPPELALPQRVCEALIRRGILIRPLGNTVVINPTFAMSEAEAQWMTQEVVEALLAQCEGGGA